MKSQAKKKKEKIEKKERKKGNNGGSQLDCTSSQEYNQHSLRPDRSTSSNVPGSLYPFLLFYMIPTWTTSISDRHIKRAWKSILYTMPCPQKKRREQIFNRSTQNGTSASNKRPILCCCWTLFDISGYYFKE